MPPFSFSVVPIKHDKLSGTFASVWGEERRRKVSWKKALSRKVNPLQKNIRFRIEEELLPTKQGIKPKFANLNSHMVLFGVAE